MSDAKHRLPDAANAELSRLRDDNAKLHEAVLGTICDPSSVGLSEYAMGCLQAVRNLGRKDGEQPRYALVDHNDWVKVADEIEQLRQRLERAEALAGEWDLTSHSSDGKQYLVTKTEMAAQLRAALEAAMKE